MRKTDNKMDKGSMHESTFRLDKMKLEEIRREKPHMAGVYRVTEHGREVGFLPASDIANILAVMPENGFHREKASWEPQWGNTGFWISEGNLQRLVDTDLLAQNGRMYTFTERSRNVRYTYTGPDYH